jgi:hypothetical protein
MSLIIAWQTLYHTDIGNPRLRITKALSHTIHVLDNIEAEAKKQSSALYNVINTSAQNQTLLANPTLVAQWLDNIAQKYNISITAQNNDIIYNAQMNTTSPFAALELLEPLNEHTHTQEYTDALDRIAHNNIFGPRITPSTSTIKHDVYIAPLTTATANHTLAAYKSLFESSLKNGKHYTMAATHPQSILKTMSSKFSNLTPHNPQHVLIFNRTDNTPAALPTHLTISKATIGSHPSLEFDALFDIVQSISRTPLTEPTTPVRLNEELSENTDTASDTQIKCLKALETLAEQITDNLFIPDTDALYQKYITDKKILVPDAIARFFTDFITCGSCANCVRDATCALRWTLLPTESALFADRNSYHHVITVAQTINTNRAQHNILIKHKIAELNTKLARIAQYPLYYTPSIEAFQYTIDTPPPTVDAIHYALPNGTTATAAIFENSPDYAAFKAHIDTHFECIVTNPVLRGIKSLLEPAYIELTGPNPNHKPTLTILENYASKPLTLILAIALAQSRLEHINKLAVIAFKHEITNSQHTHTDHTIALIVAAHAAANSLPGKSAAVSKTERDAIEIILKATVANFIAEID